MKVMKIVISILLLFAFNTNLSAQYNLYNLGLKDSDFKSELNKGHINEKLALFLANLSVYAYNDLNDESLAEFKNFATENGFTSWYKQHTLKHAGFPDDNAYMLLLNKDVVVDGVTKELVIISFRGTQGSNDILTDANFEFDKFTQNNKVRVHKGFNNILKLVEDGETLTFFRDSQSLHKKIYNPDKETIYVLTGHSLGGAIATLYAASLRERGISREQILLYTFGSPVVSDSSFNNRYDFSSTAEMPINYFRIVNNNDIVANTQNQLVPGDTKFYMHTGIPILYDEDGSLSETWFECKIPLIPPKHETDRICSSNDHSSVNYQNIFYSNLDIEHYANLIQDDGTVSITFSEEELLLIEALINENRNYQKAVSTNKFDSSKLSKEELTQLRYSISKIGINFGNKDFGTLGEALKVKTQAIADIGKTNAAKYFTSIQNAEDLQKLDYVRFAFGSAVNSAGAVADIFGVGAAAKAMKAIPKLKTFHSVLKLAKYDTILAKAPKALVKSVELLESKKFLFLQTLIEATFVMDSQLKGMIQEDAATAEMVGLVVGVGGSFVNDAITKNKNEFIGLFVGFLTDIVTGIVKEGAKVAIEDETLKAAYDELLTAIPEFIPYVGSFVSQWRLGEDISNKRSESAEAQQAWEDYNNITESTIQKIRYMSELGIAKKLNFIMNTYIQQIKPYNDKETERVAIIDKYGSYEESQLLEINATIGEKMILYVSKDVEYFSELMSVKDLNESYILRYRLEDTTLQNMNATYDEILGGFVFTSPLTGTFSLYQIKRPIAYHEELQEGYYAYKLPYYNEGVWVQKVVTQTTMPTDTNQTTDTNTTIDLNNGLVAHYEFEGNANDSSGNGNNGTEYGGVSYIDGVIGQAGSFDGVDDYMSINDSNSLDITDSITLSVWIKTNGTNTHSAIISKLGAGWYDNNAYYLNVNNDSFIHFGMNYEWENGIGLGTNSTTPVEDGEWHYIVAVYDGIRARMYVDGIFEAESGIDYTLGTKANDFKLKIGWDIYSSSRHFNGQIDDLRIYNRALNDSEIQELYKLGQQSQTVNLNSGLVAHYEFEGDANDNSGNGNNGTEHGGVTYVDGVIGKAGSFDGVDDYISVLNTPSLELNRNLTLSFWILPLEQLGHISQPSYKGVPIVCKNKHTFNNYSAWISGDLDSVGFQQYNQSLNPNYSFFVLHDFSSKKFVHIVMVRKPTSIEIYADDKLILSQSSDYDAYMKKEDLFIGYDGGYGYRTYKGLIDDLRIYNRALNDSEIQELYKLGGGNVISIVPPKNIGFLSESPKDYELKKETFVKSWTFSEDITALTPEIVSNDFSGSSFSKNGNTLSITLTPDMSKTTNKLVIRLKDENNQGVKVSGSETIWAIQKTNSAPRLADGQLTQMILKDGQTAILDIDTYDGDGDSVTLSVVDADDGVANFPPSVPNRLFCSFNNSDKTVHTITLSLSDAKESREEKITVLSLNTDTIKTFYSDVDENHLFFKDIAFATLIGAVAGQIDPTDNTKRIFRPNDNASMAEALAMILRTAQSMGKIELQSSNYYMQAYPSWSMPYYTYARENGAIDMIGSDLSIVYPTKEEIAKIIVKTLNLEDKLAMFEDMNITFSDADSFSNAAMLKYAQITNAFGLFMINKYADPQSTISRGELAEVISKMAMIPSATVTITPQDVEYGNDFNVSLSDVKAQIIDTNLTLNNNTPDIRYVADSHIYTTATINSSGLQVGQNQILVALDNDGVRDFIPTNVNVVFSDKDYDGVQDSTDKWADDARYNIDGNDNGIPDILDLIYNLGDLNSSGSIMIGSENITIQSIIENGAYIPTTHDIYLNQGWNLVALPIVGTLNIADLNNTDIEVIRSYQNNKWYVWTKENQSSTDMPLTTLTSGNGYWIKASQVTTISITGDTTYQLPSLLSLSGWRMLGSVNIDDVSTFFTQNPTVTIIWTFKDNQWYSTSKDGSINSSLAEDNNISELFGIEATKGFIIK